MSYYKPSGKFNPVLIIPGLFTGIVCTAALAYLYILLGSWIPFILVKLVLLLITIYVTLEITKLSNRIARNRNLLITYATALIFSMTLVYFSWFFFVVLELKQSFGQAFHDLWHYVQLLFSLQEYSVTTPIGWFTDSRGAEVSNWETYVVLGGESLLLLLGPLVALKVDGLDTMLYCEHCNRWAKKWKTIKKKYDVAFTTEQLEEMIRRKDLSPLLNLPDAHVENKIMFEVYEITLYRCSHCDDTYYLRIKRDNTKLSGKSDNKSEVLLNYYKLEDTKWAENLVNAAQSTDKG